MESTGSGVRLHHSGPRKRCPIRSEVNLPITKLEDDTLVKLLVGLRNPRSASHHRDRRPSPTTTSDSPSITRKHPRICSEVNPHSITKLQDDLLVEILIRLPNPRYTCRCKSVCKRWSSLISDPCFNRRLLSHHRRRTEPPPLFLPSYDPQSVIRSFIPVPDEEIGRRLTVWDSNRDLVLCGWSDPYRDNSELGRSYLVCNPFTKQWIAHPLAPEKTLGYTATLPRLVCEPRISYNLELGDGQVYVHSSEYRFRVVCVYEYAHATSNKVDIFCSESGEWTKEALILDDVYGLFHPNLLSWDEELRCCCFKIGVRRGKPVIVCFNPFRLDVPPTIYVDASAIFAKSWNLSLTQGALHVIDSKPSPAGSTVWRLEDDRESWRKQCEGLFKKSIGNCGAKPRYSLQLHPEKPEIVYVQENSVVSCCDLSKGDIEFICKAKELVPHWRVHQLSVSCWPTQITRYEQLRAVYDGTYGCWVQRSSNKVITPYIIGCQLADRVEQIGRSKGNRSTSSQALC